MAKTESKTAVAAFDACILLTETVENERQELGTDAFAAIGHRKFDVGLHALEIQIMPPFAA